MKTIRAEEKGLRLERGLFEGAVTTAGLIDMDPGCAVSEPSHQALNEMWGTPSLKNLHRADTYATPYICLAVFEGGNSAFALR